MMNKGALARINGHLSPHSLHTATKSAHTKEHSSGIAVLKTKNDTQNDIFKNVANVLMFDLSASFETFDQKIMKAL